MMTILKNISSVSNLKLALIKGACITGIAAFFSPLVGLLWLAAIAINDCNDDVECAAKEVQVMTIYAIYGIILLGIFMGSSYWIYRKSQADSHVSEINLTEG
jgi:hypothetical protein